MFLIPNGGTFFNSTIKMCIGQWWRFWYRLEIYFCLWIIYYTCCFRSSSRVYCDYLHLWLRRFIVINIRDNYSSSILIELLYGNLIIFCLVGSGANEIVLLLLLTWPQNSNLQVRIRLMTFIMILIERIWIFLLFEIRNVISSSRLMWISLTLFKLILILFGWWYWWGCRWRIERYVVLFLEIRHLVKKFRVMIDVRLLSINILRIEKLLHLLDRSWTLINVALCFLPHIDEIIISNQVTENSISSLIFFNLDSFVKTVQIQKAYQISTTPFMIMYDVYVFYFGQKGVIIHRCISMFFIDNKPSVFGYASLLSSYLRFVIISHRGSDPSTVHTGT